MSLSGAVPHADTADRASGGRAWPGSSCPPDARALSDRPLILASRSPQRRAILGQLGVGFEVRAANVEELEAGPPQEVALENARRKAEAIADQAGPGGAAILGVDTVVALEGRVYGKPPDAAAASATLTALSGKRHAVIGGICLIDAERTRTATATTAVDIRELDRSLLDWYVASGEWRERAGAYAIQGKGAALVRAISGDYLNVVGLPLTVLLELEPALLWRQRA